MSHTPDYYRILQVDPEADPDVVTAAFRTLARRLHPDRDITGVDEYRMTELNRAYAVLRDPVKRRQYDAERALMQPMGPGQEEGAGYRTGGLAARWRAREQAAEQSAGQPATATAPGGTDETVLTFGRYAGIPLRQIARQDADYLRWLARHSSGLRYRREIEAILKESL